MASDASFVEFVLEQLSSLDNISHRKMFGEYAVYYKGKVVGLICDNQVFVKSTEAGRAFIGTPIEAPPYPGAKASFLVQENLDDSEWLCELFVKSEPELNLPQKRKPKKKKT